MKKLNIKNIKLFPIVVAFTTLCAGIRYSLSKDELNTQVIIDNKVYSKLGDLDNNHFNIVNTNGHSYIYTCPTSTSTTTSTTTTTTTTTITTTTNKYSEIMFLDNIDNNYNIEQINDFIIKYSSYSHFSYDEAISIIKDNLDHITSNYSSLETGVMCTLFDTAVESNILSNYCSYDVIELREMDRDQKEAIMLDICDSFGISSNDKKIILAIFRWETGHGQSNLCVNSNNYGGIRVGNGEFGRYQTPEYGMYSAIKCIIGHINRSKEQTGSYEIYDILNHMSKSYCPGTAQDWTNKVYSMVNNVEDDYNFENGYVKKYEN